MRRSWKVLLIVTAALALTALVISAASARSRTNTKTLNMRFSVAFLTTESAELNPKGAPGDELVIYANLKGDQAAGRVGQVCTVLQAEDPPSFETSQFQCLETVELADGQLTGQELLPVDKEAASETSFAITGGTGRYREARGFGTHADNGATLTLHVEYPAG
jgi:hypothetical protein